MDPRIEKLARELIVLPLAELSAGEITERIAATLGDADPDVAQAAELVRQRTADAAKHAETLLTIFRLANATHCPDGMNAAGVDRTRRRRLVHGDTPSQHTGALPAEECDLLSGRAQIANGSA